MKIYFPIIPKVLLDSTSISIQHEQLKELLAQLYRQQTVRKAIVIEDICKRCGYNTTNSKIR